MKPPHTFTVPPVGSTQFSQWSFSLPRHVISFRSWLFKAWQSDGLWANNKSRIVAHFGLRICGVAFGTWHVIETKGDLEQEAFATTREAEQALAIVIYGEARERLDTAERTQVTHAYYRLRALKDRLRPGA